MLAHAAVVDRKIELSDIILLAFIPIPLIPANSIQCVIVQARLGQVFCRSSKLQACLSTQILPLEEAEKEETACLSCVHDTPQYLISHTHAQITQAVSQTIYKTDSQDHTSPSTSSIYHNSHQRYPDSSHHTDHSSHIARRHPFSP